MLEPIPRPPFPKAPDMKTTFAVDVLCEEARSGLAWLEGHLSPLFALYPGEEITPAKSNLFAAAKLLLQWRGEGSTGWSFAWRMPLWARVGDGDFAYRQFAGLLQNTASASLLNFQERPRK